MTNQHILKEVLNNNFKIIDLEYNQQYIKHIPQTIDDDTIILINIESEIVIIGRTNANTIYISSIDDYNYTRNTKENVILVYFASSEIFRYYDDDEYIHRFPYPKSEEDYFMNSLENNYMFINYEMLSNLPTLISLIEKKGVKCEIEYGHRKISKQTY